MRRAVLAMLRPRATRSQAIVGLLCATLGFALVVQVRSTDAEDGLGAAREEDLVRILDEVTTRSDRLRRDIAELERARDEVTGGADRSKAALEEARERAAALGILAGTAAATGPGIILTIRDPQGMVDAEVVLNAVEELRAAGAEAMQIGDVRIVAATYFLDTEDGIVVDGVILRPPYLLRVIGDPDTLSAALDIPGGVTDTIRHAEGASAFIQEREEVQVSALRLLETPQYARPGEPEDD